VADLAVLVPSRGRPKNVARLIEACEKTCRADTIVSFGFDEDDPELLANMDASGDALVTVRPRMGLGAWTNALAAIWPGASYLGSLGDDMVPVTDGWDEKLIAAQEAISGGWTYPDDLRRTDIPEACVIDRRIVDALGWMCEPSIGHWYTDTVWADLGIGTGRLKFVPAAVVEHRHPNLGKARTDATYHEAAQGFAGDLAAYQKWRMKRMRADIETVRECLNPPG
jgi:hypothetical protein